MSIYSGARVFGPKLIDTFTNDNPIALERKVTTADGGGGNSVSWSSVATLSGAVLPLSGNKAQEFDRLNIKVTHAVYLKYSDASTVALDDRLVFRGRNFIVRWINNIAEADSVIKIMCEEGVR